MSIQKKSAISIVKKDLTRSKLPTLGVKKLMFAHKATAGESLIDLNSLTTPPEFTALGFSPSPTNELLAARMYFYRKNLRLHSSTKGELVDYIDYTVDSNSVISFTETFGTTVADEVIVGWLDPVVKSGSLVADADSVVVTGELTPGQTEINIGKSKPIINISQQLGSVELQIEGQTYLRNVANDTAAPAADGDYEEVDNGDGFFTIIKLNNPAVGGEAYIVKSTAIDVIRPDGSVLDAIEKQQGVVDKLVETTAVLAGVPETNFQAAPTQPQLKQFGDRLIDLESGDITITGQKTFNNEINPLGGIGGIGSSASAGQVGEVITGAATGPNASLSADVPADFRSLTLSAGTWVLSGTGYNIPGTGWAWFEFLVCISLVSNTMNTTTSTSVYSTAGGRDISIGVTRILHVSSPTTVYLVGRARNNAGTAGGFARRSSSTLQAVRIR